MASKKIYVLDTNVLVHDPEALYTFKGVHVGIPIMVLEELDKFKSENTDRGYNARQAIRHLDELRSRGSLRDGVELDGGTLVRALFVPEKALESEILPASLSLDVMDNLILLTALHLKESGFDVRFISKDLNARVKADALGVIAQDYIKEQVAPDTFYKGWQVISVPAISLKKDLPPELAELVEEDDLTTNQFIILESNHNPFNYKIFRYLGEQQFREVVQPQLQWPLEARNVQQLMALDLLFDPEIQLISLLGPAGTGKTFLALLAGLHQVLVQDEFEKMLVSRPVIPLGADIGYLPGTIEEKLHSWMQPIYDNMDFIIHSINIGHLYHEPNDADMIYANKKPHKKKRKKYERPEKHIDSLDELIKRGKISLEAITYMRGRSIPYQFIFIDEVQNLTPHEVKTLISRVGEGSKIVLAGDPYQIDSPYLDFSSNGLTVATNKFRGYPIFGTVFLQISERSALAKLVSEIWNGSKYS
jgi:PhoH-like ATPase